MTHKELKKFVANIEFQPNGCILWTGAVSKLHGYARFFADGKDQEGHRVAYKHFRGEIPSGLQLDHLCRTRNCVNAWHLEIVTQRENIMRGQCPAAINAHKTHCKRGHSLHDAKRHILRNGRLGRKCRTCENERDRLARKGLKLPDTAGKQRPEQTACISAA